MDGRNRGGAGQRHAERLGNAGHRARRAHHRAGAGGGGEPALDLLDLARRRSRWRDSAPRSAGNRCRRRGARHGGAPSTSARRRAGSPADRRRPRPSAAPARSCRNRPSAPPHPSAGRGSCPRCRAPSGCGTSGWSGEEHLAERDRGKLEGSAAGREDAALHGGEHLGEMAVTVVEAARGLGDADHRTGEHLVGVAHRAGEERRR